MIRKPPPIPPAAFLADRGVSPDGRTSIRAWGRGTLLSRKDAVARNEALSAVSAGAALLCALAAFLGWVFHSPGLRGFGIDVPIWPLTALGFAGLAGAQLALLRGHRGTAFALAAFPLLLSISGALQALTGYNSGIHGLLFADELARVRAATPGRPAYMILVEWVLLFAAMLLASRRTWRACLTACLLANIPLALSIMTIGLTTAGVRIPGGPAAYLWASLPASIATILLSVSLFFWCRAATWTGTATGEDLAGWTFTRAFPLVLLVPGLTWLFEIVAYSRGAGARSFEMVAVGLNVLLVVAILGWAIYRMSRQQAALRDFTHALDSTSIALIHPDGTIAHWSRGCEQLFGWTATEAIGARKHVLLNTKLDGGECSLAKLPPGGELRREVTDTAKDGRELRVLEHVRRIDDGRGPPVLVVALTDVTERARMEADLRTSEARLAAAVEAHDLAVFDWDPVGRNLLWGAGADLCLGMPAEQLKDWEAWRQFVHPDDYARMSRTFAAALAERAPRHHFQYRFSPPDASPRTIEGSACCFYDEAGNLTRSIGVQFDVTDREKREADLESRRVLLRAILDTVPDAMVAFDEEGIIRRISPGAVTTLGYTAEEAVGQHFTIIAAEARREAYASAIDRYLQTGIAQYIGRATRTFARRADGSEIPVELRAAEALAGGKRLFILFLRDLTETIANEDRLGSLAAELGHVSRLSAMGEMAAGMAHELNQPLTAIANYLGAAGALMQEGGDSAKARELVETANRQTIRAGQIIRRMRDFASKGHADVEPVSVKDTIRDAVALVFVGPTPLEIKLDYDLDPKADTMRADRIQIQQVLVNLLRNAVQAMQRAQSVTKEIVLATRVRGNEMIEIGVCDSGPGISEATRAKLFEPFTASSEKGGMGVGLSICRRILEAHGGEIWSEDREEGGTVFRFTVPLFKDEED